MKRQSFMIASAGALLAGCASPSAIPTGAAPAQRTAVTHPDDSSAQLLGSIMLAPYTKTPKDFVRCDGQVMKIDSNVALFSLIENRFGGDGKTTFALPDLSQHVPLAGLTYFIATRGIYPNRKQADPNFYLGLPLLGQIVCLAYEAKYLPPGGWAVCNGDLLDIDKNVALYSLVGDEFGGDGRRTFALPDLRKHQVGKNLTYAIATAGRYPNLG